MPNDPPEKDHPYASRGGLKMAAALTAFGVDVTGWQCADLGCSTGGFTSCLLHHGAAHVYAVDTAYGELAWALRQDDRVTVMERSNAMHTDPPAEALGQMDLVTIDLGWTRQNKALPAAMKWLRPGGRIITLVKPHYEQPRKIDRLAKSKGTKKQPKKHPPMPVSEARAVCERVLAEVGDDPALGLEVLGVIDSPIRGGKGGNLEQLALLATKQDHTG